MFILDESLFTKGTQISFKGYTLYSVTKKNVDLNVTLNKTVFGFDSKYADIAKLYTFPYSSLEITDDEGNSFNARIENCGTMKIHEEVSLVYPYLNYNVFLSGVNGDGTMSYTWKDVSGTSSTKTMWASDFSKFMMNWNIPTYSLFVSSENEYAANNFFDVKARRARAIKDYENAVRYANTTYENTDDSYATNTANVNRTTTKNVTNTAAVQAGLIDNMEDTNDTQDYIVDELQNSGSFGSQIAAGNGYISNTAWANFEKVADDCDTDWSVLEQGFGITRDFQVGMGIINVGSALAGSSIQSGGEGFASEGGVPIPIVGGICNGITTAASTAMVITNEQSMKIIQQNAITDKITHARTQTEKLHDIQKYYGHNSKEASNDLRESITKRFSDTYANDGINNVNENRNKTCEDANALATQTTETNNADWTRDANVVAEKANLVQKQLEAENAYKNARLQVPYEQGSYSGDFMPDAYQRRGIRLNVRTQSKAAIAQAGDAMLRFGYALHRVWDMSNGFHYCKNFTFWKAEDIWINDGTGVANVATNFIANILLSGVTVWRDASKIGTVGIYDNFEGGVTNV